MKRQLPGWAVLLLITLVAGLALGATYALTRDAIDAQAVAAAENARKAALPEADSFKRLLLGEGEAVDWCYAGSKNGAVVGYVAQVTAQGFGGPLEVIAGLDTGMALTGVSVGGSGFSETAGLGAKAKDPSFAAQFVGKQTPVKVIKAGGTPADDTIDAITSATITSSAVAGAVNKIANYIEAILFPEGRGNAVVLPEKPETGVFGASSKGYHGPVWVDAAFDGTGKITYISIGNEDFAETEGIGARVLEPEFQAQFIDKQMPLEFSDIDALTGATISSQAVVNALNKAYDKSLGVEPVPATPAPTAPVPAAGGNNWSASAKGYDGPVWIEATFEDGKITALRIGDNRFAETDGVGSRALAPEFAGQFIGKSAPLALSDIDALTGATVTSQAVVDAINKAYDKSIAGQ